MKLAKKKEEEHMLMQVVTELFTKLPQCNINLEAPLLAKVKVIVGWAMELKGKVEKMDAEYKAHNVDF